jgi:hypothetical protein
VILETISTADSSLERPTLRAARVPQASDGANGASPRRIPAFPQIGRSCPCCAARYAPRSSLLNTARERAILSAARRAPFAPGGRAAAPVRAHPDVAGFAPHDHLARAMPRRIEKLLLVATLVAASAAIAPAVRPLPVETRVVPPLADPAVVPGVARCTSDGACTVTDDAGTRPGPRVTVTGP